MKDFIKNKNISISKFLLTVAISIYMIYYLFSLSDWHFIDNINLIFHEAGHIIFWIFGDILHTLGGTLMQILVPATLSFYFYKNEEYYSASLLLFWLSQSFFNVSVYARDAIKMELPLLGGDNVFHDWNHLLSSINLLKHTYEIASAIYFIGIIILVFAVMFSVNFSTKNTRLNTF